MGFVWVYTSYGFRMGFEMGFEMLYWFRSKFHALSGSAKFDNRLRFDKVTESLKVETF